MGKLVLFWMTMFLFQVGNGQNKKNQEVDIVSHSVQMGETIRMLSKKYLVDPSEIYRLNKFAVNGIHQGDVLQIPVPRKEAVVQQEEAVAENPTATEQPVEVSQEPPTETVTKPAKKKPVVVAQEKTSEQSEIKPAETAVVQTQSASASEHTVQQGETLYSLSRQYGVSVTEIKNANPQLSKGLKIGQIVQIPSGQSVTSTTVASVEKPIETKTEIQSAVQSSQTNTNQENSTQAITSGQTITHEVAPKETLYSLSKRYNVTVDQIKAQNPDVAKHGLQIGQTLTITTN